MKEKKQRKITIPIQFEGYQVDILEPIMELERIKAYAVLVRKMFDFYVEKNYPQLMPEEAE